MKGKIKPSFLESYLFRKQYADKRQIQKEEESREYNKKITKQVAKFLKIDAKYLSIYDINVLLFEEVKNLIPNDKKYYSETYTNTPEQNLMAINGCSYDFSERNIVKCSKTKDGKIERIFKLLKVNKNPMSLTSSNIYEEIPMYLIINAK